MVVVIIMAILFAIVGGSVLIYTRTSIEIGHRQVRKIKAYYAAEAGLCRGVYEANAGKTGGPYNWQISDGQQEISSAYTITDGGSGTTTVTSKVSSLSNLKLYFEEP